MPGVSARFEDLTAEQQNEIVDFLIDNFIPTKAINQRHSAYGLKQKFSRDHFYVTQEQFTRAMELAGFKVLLLKNGNARFNISERAPYFR